MTNSQKKYLVILLAAVLILFPLIIKFALTCDTCDPPCGPCGSCSGGDCGPKCTFPKTNCCTKYNPETGKDEFKDCCDTDINCCDGVCCANPNENCCDGVCRSECGSCCCGNYFCPQNTNCCAHTDTPYYSCCKSGSECCCCVPTENPEVYDQYCGGNCRTCDGEPLCEEGEKCCHGYRPSLDGTTRICCDSDTQLCCEGTCCNIQNCEECVAATDIQGCPYMECQDKCDPVTETCCYGPCCSNENQTCCHSNNNNAGACCNPGEECCQADDDAECCDTSIGEMCCTGLNGADCCDTQIQFCCEGDCCDNICQKCEGGECVDDCEACHKCVSGKCVPCDPCEDCISGKCAPKECKPCHTCNPETGACENDCTQPCQKCEGGECVTCDGDCEECIDDVCVDNCTEDCEECVGDICLATECPDCETCTNDECQSDCEPLLCEICVDDSCIDKCNDCQICNNGVCVDNCTGDCVVCSTGGSCKTCAELGLICCNDGNCYESCDGTDCEDDEDCNSCYECNEDNFCEPIVCASLCEECHVDTGFCEEKVCPVCQECVNDECQPKECGDCQKCDNGNCVNVGPWVIDDMTIGFADHACNPEGAVMFCANTLHESNVNTAQKTIEFLAFSWGVTGDLLGVPVEMGGSCWASGILGSTYSQEIPADVKVCIKTKLNGKVRASAAIVKFRIWVKLDGGDYKLLHSSGENQTYNGSYIFSENFNSVSSGQHTIRVKFKGEATAVGEENQAATEFNNSYGDGYYIQVEQITVECN